MKTNKKIIVFQIVRYFNRNQSQEQITGLYRSYDEIQTVFKAIINYFQKLQKVQPGRYGLNIGKNNICIYDSKEKEIENYKIMKKTI